jgi:hypothetical protein
VTRLTPRQQQARTELEKLRPVSANSLALALYPECVPLRWYYRQRYVNRTDKILAKLVEKGIAVQMTGMPEDLPATYMLDRAFWPPVEGGDKEPDGTTPEVGHRELSQRGEV